MANQPFANILDSDGTKAINAPMPIILLQDDEADIQMPKPFSADVARKARLDNEKAVILVTLVAYR